MDDLQYMVEVGNIEKDLSNKVLNLVINGWPSIQSNTRF